MLAVAALEAASPFGRPELKALYGLRAPISLLK
jgi:hypothetical protein